MYWPRVCQEFTPCSLLFTISYTYIYKKQGNQVEAEKSSTKLHDLKSSTTPQPSAMAVPSSVEEVAKSAIQYLEDLRGTWFLVQNNAANARGKPLTPDQVNRGYNAYGIFLEKTEQALGEFVEKIGEDPE